jgi:hypothetical protein
MTQPHGMKQALRVTVRLRLGAVLLESLVALVLLGTIASTAAWAAAEQIRGLDRQLTHEEEVRAAVRLLTAVSVWPAADLDRRLGETSQREWILIIRRPEASLYEVELIKASTTRPLVSTTLYRAGS